MGGKHMKQDRSEMRGRNVLCANLHDTGRARLCMCEQYAKIEIVCEDYRFILTSPPHDFRIGRIRFSNR